MHCRELEVKINSVACNSFSSFW